MASSPKVEPRHQAAAHEWARSQTPPEVNVFKMDIYAQACADTEAQVLADAARWARDPKGDERDYLAERCRTAWQLAQDSGVMRESDGRTGNESLDDSLCILDELATHFNRETGASGGG